MSEEEGAEVGFEDGMVEGEEVGMDDGCVVGFVVGISEMTWEGV